MNKTDSVMWPGLGLWQGARYLIDKDTWDVAYDLGYRPPNYPVPAIPLIHQWDFSLWVLLETTPPMSDDEWEREEDEWQDFLDNLDNET